MKGVSIGYSEHLLSEPEQNAMQYQIFTATLSILLENGNFNRGHDKIQIPTFSTKQNTKQWQALALYPVNASENGNLSFLTKSFKRLEWLRKLKHRGPTWESTEWICHICFFNMALVLSLSCSS